MTGDDPTPLQKDERGVKAKDILKFQFPNIADDKVRERLRRYRNDRGLKLPTAKFYGNGKNVHKEYDCYVVTDRLQLNELLGCFSDKGERFLKAYSKEVETWFPASTSGATSILISDPAGIPQRDAPRPRAPLPGCVQALNGTVVLPSDNSITATFPDWPTFKQFKEELELQTATTYNTARQSETKPGSLTREYRCMFGGKPSFKERKKRISRVDFTRSNAGKSRKCECEARLVVRLPTTYARELGLTTLGAASCSVSKGGPSRQPNEAPAAPLTPPAAPVTNITSVAAAVGPLLAGTAEELPNPSVPPPAVQQETTIHVRLYLEHTKHTPFSPEDLKRQPVHPAVAEKATELALQAAPYAILKEQLYAFADQLVQTLGIPRNLGDNRFYPRPETIRNLRDAVLRKSRMHKVDQEECKTVLDESQQTYSGSEFGLTNQTLAGLNHESVLQPHMTVRVNVTQSCNPSIEGVWAEKEGLERDTDVPMVQEEERLDEMEEEDAAATAQGDEVDAAANQDNLYGGGREICRELANLLYRATFSIPSSQVASLQQQLQGCVDSLHAYLPLPLPSHHLEIASDFTYAGCKRRKLAPPRPLPAFTPLVAQQQPPSVTSQRQAVAVPSNPVAAAMAVLSQLQAAAALSMPSQLQAEAAALMVRSQLQAAIVPGQLQASPVTIASVLGQLQASPVAIAAVLSQLQATEATPSHLQAEVALAAAGVPSGL
ncbi:hypothetical protein Vafri_1893 [Volvox africanus]|nr:hypothetical protein Vafri_1893 [Volvox africanus]